MDRSLPALALLSLLFLAGCSDVDPRRGSFETPPVEWRLLDTLRIGSVEGPDDALTRVGRVLPLPGGGSWFTQPSEQRIRVVTADGRLAGEAGGRGQGPGEFTAMGSAGHWKGGPDTIWVQDWALRRLTLLGPDGAFAGSFPVPEVTWGDRWSVGDLAAVGPGGVALALGNYAPGQNDWDEGYPILRFTLPDGGGVAEVARVERTAALQLRWEGAVVATGFHPLDDAPIVSASPGGRRLAITRRDAAGGDPDPRIVVTVLGAEGDTAWERSLGYDPAPIAAAEVDSIWGERVAAFQRFAELEGRMSPEDAERAYRASVPVPRHRPPVEGVHMDAEGRVLLVRGAPPGASRQAWLLSSEGELVAWIELPGGQALMGFEGEHLWVVEEDEVGVPFLLRYRVGPG